MDVRNTELLKDTLDSVENIEFSDVNPKLEIKQEEQFKIENPEFWKSPTFDDKPKLEQVEASETAQAKIETEVSENGLVKIKTEPEELFSNTCNSSFIEEITLNSQLGTNRNSDLLIKFAESIEFSDNAELKTEIKEEEEFKKENKQFWKSPIVYVKPKLDQVQSSETAQAKIKTEPEKFLNNDPEVETLNNESLEIKDEFMWAVKDFVSDSVPPRNMEQQIAVINEKKSPFDCSLVDLNKHNYVEHEKKKPFDCSLCPYKSGCKGDLKKHIAAVHEKKKPFEWSMCPSKFFAKGNLTVHIASLHEKKKLFQCSMCPSKGALD